MTESEQEKVTYMFDNIASDKLSDAEFAKTLQKILVAYCMFLLKSCNEKNIQCGLLEGEKGKVVCMIDKSLAELLPLDALKAILSAGKNIAMNVYPVVEGLKQ